MTNVVRKALWSVLFAALSAGVGQARMLYRSDFASLPDGPANTKGWTLTGGAYRISKGRLHVTSVKSNPLATLKVKQDGDGTFRATVRNARNCHRVGLVARGFRLEINNQYVRAELHGPMGKRTKRVAHSPYRPFSRFEHEFELRLVFVGRRVVAFIDRKKLLEYESPAPIPPGGRYGLMGGWGTEVAWRNVSLSDEPDLSEWPRETPPTRAPKGLVKVTGVRGLRDDGIYFDGEEAGLRLKLTTHRPEESRAELQFRLIDVRQKVVARKDRSVLLAPAKEHDLTVTFRPKKRGCFKVALDAGPRPGDLGWVEDLGAFTVVPRALHDGPRNPASYFGGHMDGIHLEWHLDAGRKIGIRWARCHDMLQHTWWTRIQPKSRDQWIWRDKTQQTIDRLGFSTLGEFLWTPDWATSATSGKRQAAPPKGLDDFGRYVFETVKHHRPSIKHWEVWNEPHYAGFWRGTPEQYAGLLEVAYRQAKKADPDCVVLGGGGVYIGRLDWTRRMLAALKGRPMDVFSIHYVTPEAAGEQLARLRRLLAGKGRGKGRKDVPVWNTEASVRSTSFLDQCRAGRMHPEARYHFRNACSELVRMYMENIANGVERVFYYHQADPWRFRQFPKPRIVANPPLGTGMWDEGRALKPIAAAHAALAGAIRGMRYQSRLTSGPMHAFIFEGKGASTAVQYATFREFSRRAAIRLTMPRGVRAADLTVIDFMGNESPAPVKAGTVALPFSCEPVYLVCRARRAAAILAEMYRNAAIE